MLGEGHARSRKLDAVECGEEGGGVVYCETLVWENVAFVFRGKGFDIGERNIFVFVLGGVVRVLLFFVFGAGTVGVIET